MDNLNDKISNEAQNQPSCLGAVSGSNFKLILTIAVIWILYVFGWYFAYTINNVMCGFIMVMLTITMTPLMATGAAIDYFR